jgi:integrase
VPLSPAALAILKPLHAIRTGAFVFPGRKANDHLKRKGLQFLIGNMKLAGTIHGFRSSFRDWAAEKTTYPHEVCEQALAHLIGNGVTRAYLRGDAFDKRRSLMESWGAYCSAEPGAVLPFRARRE